MYKRKKAHASNPPLSLVAPTRPKSSLLLVVFFFFFFILLLQFPVSSVLLLLGWLLLIDCSLPHPFLSA